MSITLLIIVTIILVCFFLALKNPSFGVLGYLIIYFIYNPNAWYGEQLQNVLYRPSMVASIFLIIGCLVNYQKLSWKFSRREFEIYLFMASLFIVSYSFGKGVEEDNWFYLEKMLKLTVFLFLFFRVIYNSDHIRLQIWGIIFGTIFLSFQAHQTGAFSGGRLDNIGGSDFAEANALAAFLCCGLVFLGFKLFEMQSLKKLIVLLPIPLIINTIIMTESRSAFVGLFIALIFVLLKSTWKIKKEILIYVMLGSVLFVFLGHDRFWERMVGYDDQIQRIENPSAFENENLPLSRLDFWASSIQIFKDYPMGIGVKNFEKIVPLYDPRNPGMDPHNTFVLCYSEVGIIGIILFIIILLEAFAAFRKIEKLENFEKIKFDFFIFSTVLIMYFMGPCLTHSEIYSELTWILLSLSICHEKSLNSMPASI